MKSVIQLYVFRHGETDWNREGRFQGHLDVPLNETGREQARELVPKLRASAIEAVLSSDLSRAQETGRIVAEGLGVPMHIDERLREAHLGQAQGLTHTEISARFGDELIHRWRSYLPTDADVGYAGGETGRQVTDRVFAAMEAGIAQLGVRRLGISTHGGVIRRMMQKLLPAGSEPVPIPNGVLYVLGYDPEHPRWFLPSQLSFPASAPSEV